MIWTWWVVATLFFPICLHVSSFPSAIQSWHTKQFTDRIVNVVQYLVKYLAFFTSWGKSLIEDSFCYVFIFSFSDFCWYRQHYSTDQKMNMFWSIWSHNHCSYFKSLRIDSCSFFSLMTSSKCFPNVVFPYLKNSTLSHETSAEPSLTLLNGYESFSIQVSHKITCIFPWF